MKTSPEYIQSGHAVYYCFTSHWWPIDDNRRLQFVPVWKITQLDMSGDYIQIPASIIKDGEIDKHDIEAWLEQNKSALDDQTIKAESAINRR